MAGGKAGFHKGEHTWRKSESNSGKSNRNDPPAQPPIRCPQCQSRRVWKDGLRYYNKGENRPIQRYICRECGKRFSENSKPLQTVPYGSLNTTYAIPLDRRVCVSEVEMKNLAKVETRQKRAAGATIKSSEAKVKGKIIEYLWFLKKQGYAESTIITRTRILKRLVKLGADILDPESVKEIIATQKWMESTKAIAINTYTSFLKANDLTWTPPITREVRTLPFIPTEREIDQLIASCGNKTAAFLQTLKETGMRAGEAWSLEWTDVDTVRRTVKLRPEKGSNPRIFKVSNKLIDMLNALPRKSKKVFGDILLGSIRATFCASRRRAAEKLKNPRLLQIHFHTFRHWKATTLYHQTKDVLYVMNFLGHRSIKNTMLYIQLEEALFKDNSDEFTSRIAKTVREGRLLVEAGFDYVCEFDGVKIFRKRK